MGIALANAPASRTAAPSAAFESAPRIFFFAAIAVGRTKDLEKIRTLSRVCQSNLRRFADGGFTHTIPSVDDPLHLP